MRANVTGLTKGIPYNWSAVHVPDETSIDNNWINSDPHLAASFTTGGSSGTRGTNTPPTGIGSRNPSNHRVLIYWTKYTSVHGGGFTILYWKSTETESDGLEAHASKTATSKILTNLDPNTTYKFKIKTEGGPNADDSVYSSEYTFTTTNVGTDYRPGGLEETAIVGGATFTWDAPTFSSREAQKERNITGYDLRYKDITTSPFKYLRNLSKTCLLYTSPSPRD